MLNKIRQTIDNLNINNETLMAHLAKYVNIESYTKNPQGVTTLCNTIAQDLESIGVRTRIIQFPEASPTLIGEYGQGDPSQGLVLSGHMDTVFKDGFLLENPFRIEGNKAYGPGALDMKGGIVLIYALIQILKELNYTLPIKILISGDEETAHSLTGSEVHIQDEVRGYKYALNMETGLVNNGITVGRKGNIFLKMLSKGIAAHSGANFNEGVSAIYDIARKTAQINALNQHYENATFNVGLISGGSMVNAVPDYAEISIDVRYTDTNLTQSIMDDLKTISANSIDPRIQESIEIISKFPPFTNHLNMKLYELANEISIANGFGETTPEFLGGCSDASFITLAGVPVLCSMGMKGRWNHTNREYVNVDSGIERLQLLTLLILQIAEGREI